MTGNTDLNKPQLSEFSTSGINFGGVLIDFMAVVLGVLLAFMLNEWRLNARQTKTVERNIVAVHTELENNYEALDRIRDYRINIYTGLQIVRKGDMSFEDVNFRGTRPPRMQNAAYQMSIQNSTLSEIPQSEGLAIIRAYTAQEATARLHSQYTAGIVTNMDQAGNEAFIAEFLSSAFLDFLYSEEETMNLIADVLDKPTLTHFWDEIESRKEDTEDNPVNSKD